MTPANPPLPVTPILRPFTLSAQTTTPLPRGIAGHFVGSIGASAIVAGGSWWTAHPAQGGRKVWDKTIQIRDSVEGQWRLAGHLPHPAAYGASLSLSHGIVLAGGQDADRALSDVLFLSLTEGHLKVQPWPSLPVPLINCSLGMAGNTIYVMCGQEGPDKVSTNQVWSLALDTHEQPATAWRKEPDAPFTDRILAASGSSGNRLYLAGGAQLTKSHDGNLARNYLHDAWSFQTSSGWVQLPNLPTPAVAAPASCAGPDHFIVFGGDDGHMAGVVLKPGETHPGFSRSIFQYRSETNHWEEAAKLPAGLVTTGAAVLKDGTIIIPGGEDRPGHRSAEVLELKIVSCGTSNQHSPAADVFA